MQILSVFWGEKHFSIFRDVALRSLKWKKNVEALNGSTWNIFCDAELHNKFQGLVPDTITVNLRPMNLLMDFIDPFQAAFVWAIKQCLELDQRLLIVPPDLMFGDGTVPNLIKIGRDKSSVVVVPHVRVLPEALKFCGPFTNPQLVALAFSNLHRSWIDAEMGHPNNSSFHGGVEWEKLGCNLWSVRHMLPAPYLMDFTKEDLSYFESVPTFNSLDHQWPGDILVPRGRMRYVGSSDACFLVEPTEPMANIPNILPNQPKSGGFHRDQVHNRFNNQVRCIMRGE